MSLRDEIRKTDYLIRHPIPHIPGTPILRASGLSVNYEAGRALRDVSFELEVGERLAVVGPNGAGKSTLFKVIAGLITPSEGKVNIYGQEPGGHTCIAYVPQRNLVDWNFPVNVADVVMMGRVRRLRLFRQPRRSDWEIVEQCLEIVGMLPLAKRQINELSGGQQQRMFIARALAQEAELMLMDEPFTGLDLNSQETIFQILEELQKRAVTLMVALHDLQMAAERFDRIMLLNRRLVGIGRSENVLSTENLVEAYGGRLRLLETDEGVIALEDGCCGEGEHEHD